MNRNYEMTVAGCECTEASCNTGRRLSVCEIVKDNNSIINEIGSHLAYIKDTVDLVPQPPSDGMKEAEPNSLMEDLLRQNRRITELLRMTIQIRDTLCGSN